MQKNFIAKIALNAMQDDQPDTTDYIDPYLTHMSPQNLGYFAERQLHTSTSIHNRLLTHRKEAPMPPIPQCPPSSSKSSSDESISSSDFWSVVSIERLTLQSVLPSTICGASSSISSNISKLFLRFIVGAGCVCFEDREAGEGEGLEDNVDTEDVSDRAGSSVNSIQAL